MCLYADSDCYCFICEDTCKSHPDNCEHLKNYEHKGKFVTLPCKLGDKVYCVANEYIYTVVIHEFRIVEYGIYAFGYGTDPRNMGERYRFIVTTYGSTQTSHFGKTVFFTQEEAEEVLKQNRGEENNG